jgi:SAM-dependent methyltransferase
VDERAAYTWIGHRGMSICNPISSEALDVTIDAMPLAPGARCLDLGCGKGELLMRLARRHGCHGTGYDLNAALLAHARESAEGLPIELLEEDLCRAPLDGSWDLVAAIGASHALGGTQPSLQALSEAARPEGLASIGEGYWRRGASADARAAIGDGLLSLDGLVEAGGLVDLVPLHVEVASEQDWDRYEWAHQRNLEENARAHPEDELAQRLLARGRAWRQLYLRFGRDALGFALVVFRKR